MHPMWCDEARGYGCHGPSHADAPLYWAKMAFGLGSRKVGLEAEINAAHHQYAMITDAYWDLSEGMPNLGEVRDPSST